MKRPSESIEQVGAAPSHAARPRPAEGRARSAASRKITEPFVRGPIPLRWLAQASALRGSALAVGILLWFRSGLARSRVDLTVPRPIREAAGVSRFSLARGLRALARARLVEVTRASGRSARVSICDAEVERAPLPHEVRQ